MDSLTADDFASLDTAQKDAVLAALFVALIADGVPEPSEIAAFSAAIAKLPWGEPIERLQAKMRAVQARLDNATRDEKIAFLDETVPAIPTPLRMRVIETMVSITAADNVLTRGERGSLGAFIRAFGLTAEQVDVIRARFVGRPTN
ncbi:MAG: TerB family tellurite resistance protein [Kofleriaceae bacterium]